MTKTFSKKDFKLQQREVIHQGFVSIARFTFQHKLFKGGWSGIITRDIAEHRQAAALLPYDPKLDRVILIEQFRIGTLTDPTGPWQLEIPAGLLEPNESPEQLAIRETKEEAGCEVKNVKLIYDYYASPGSSDEYLYIFYGEVDSTNVDGIHGLDHEDEDIKVINISAAEAFEKLKRGEIKNGPALVALQWLQLNKELI